MCFQTFIQDNRFCCQITHVIHLTIPRITQAILLLCSALQQFCYSEYTEEQSHSITEISLDANMSFQIYPARSSIQKTSSCAAHSLSGQGEHTRAPGFQFLHKHRLPSQLLTLSYTSIPTLVTPPYSSATLSIANKTANSGCFCYSSKQTSL